MWEECAADSASQYSFLGIPGTTARGVGRLEDPQTLEAFNERVVAKELDGIPVQTWFDGLE